MNRKPPVPVVSLRFVLYPSFLEERVNHLLISYLAFLKVERIQYQNLRGTELLFCAVLIFDSYRSN
jgi:hypothetical protein